MRLHDVLALSVLHPAQVVAGGQQGLSRDVRWAHIVDIPEPVPWVQSGQLVLTTGYAWPHDDDGQRELVRGLALRCPAGIALAVPHFFERFSDAARAEADAAGLALIEIPWDIPFAQITEVVHRAILEEQYHVIEQAEAIHRKLTQAALEGASLQELATALGNLLDRAISIEDFDGRILAFHSIAGEEDPVRQISIASGQTPPDVMADLERSGYLRQIYRATKPVHIPAMPQLGFKARVACPIHLKGEDVGLVWIIEGEQLLSELDVRAAEQASLVAALYIAQQRELSSLEARLGYNFIDTLLEGRFEATPHALDRARLLGFDPKARYRVGLLVLDEPVPLSREGFLRRESLADRLRRNLKCLGLAPLVSVTLNRVSFLLPEQWQGEQIWKLLGDQHLSLAYGQAHAGIEGVQASHRETLSMLPYLAPHACQYYDHLLLPRVLMGDAEAQGVFVEKLLGPLKKQRNGEVLKETLLTWARHGCHFGPVAQLLNIHAKTLQYRLSRASEMLNLDLGDSDVRFQLQLAARLLALPEQQYS
jgi:purine catabolism regulator